MINVNWETVNFDEAVDALQPLSKKDLWELATKMRIKGFKTLSKSNLIRLIVNVRIGGRLSYESFKRLNAM